MFITLSLLDPSILWCLFGYLWGIVFAILHTIYLYHLLITWSDLNSFMTYPSSLILRQFILPNIWSSLGFVNGVIKRISIICNMSTQLVFTHSLRNNLFQTSDPPLPPWECIFSILHLLISINSRELVLSSIQVSPSSNRILFYSSTVESRLYEREYNILRESHFRETIFKRKDMSEWKILK